MRPLVERLRAAHRRAFAALESALDGWFLGLLARFVFAAVLLLYFLNSARTKVGDGLLGFFDVADNAYYQIVLPAVEAAGGDVSQVALVPWGLIVWAGTYAEFALPLLIVAGLFTRLAALGMIVFVIVQSYVDIAVHNVDAQTVGAWFDRFPAAPVADQRLLWGFLLIFLVVRGAGRVSLDAALARWWQAGSRPAATARPA